MRAVRRVVILLVVAAAVVVAVTRRRRATETSSVDGTESIWPPFEPVAPEPATPEQVAAWAQPTDGVAPGPVWRAPVGGTCPDGFPIKANDNSGIYHLPGGRFYARTVPERCYAAAADAEADGYRRAKA